jgi:hypothetical protein
MLNVDHSFERSGKARLRFDVLFAIVCFGLLVQLFPSFLGQ